MLCVKHRMKVVQTMKKKMAFLFGLLLVLTYLSAAVAEETVTPADQPFQNEAIEQAHLIAQEKLKKDYVYNPQLFTCMLRNEKDEAFEFTFNWIYSTVTIYAVSVPADLSEDNIEVAYNTDYSMDSYYTELCAHFCPDGGLFGDWTIEQKAWLSSIIDAHWELETFRTYYINPDYQPYMSPFYQRLLENEHCGIPDENSITEEDALSIATQYVEQDKALSSLKPWKKIQTFYFINNPSKPVWCIRLWKDIDNIYDITIDAHTGEIQKISEMEQ